MLLSVLNESSILASTSGENMIFAGAIMIFLYAAILAFIIWIYVRILNKLGYSGLWVLLGFVPFAVIIGMIILAFKESPVEEEVKRLRMMNSGNNSQSPQQYQSPYGTNPHQ